MPRLTSDSMKTDLELDVGYRYVSIPTVDLFEKANMKQSIAVLIFFVPYVIFQPPMTVLIRKLGPTYFLGTIIVSWGVIMIVC